MAAQVGVEHHIVVVEEPRQALVGIGVAAGGEFGPAARERDKREERRCPERQENRFGFGDQGSRGLVPPTLCHGDRFRQFRRWDIKRETGLRP